MITGIGIDVLRYERIKEEILKYDDAFVKRVFTSKEIINADNRDNRQQYFAGLYAAKEAVFKALRLQPDNVKFSEIEITRNENGAPEVSLGGILGWYADEQDLHLSISLSYETDFVEALAVCEKQLPEQVDINIPIL